MRNLRPLLGSGAMLAVFQILGLAIPLATLPFVARALGVEEFGKVMLAQAIAFFGVVFIDSGFNTESQRRAALAQDDRQSLQALYDNLRTRSLCALPVIAGVLVASLFFKDVPVLYIVLALLHVAGTLAFPQWWLISSNMGWQMGLASTAGRLIAAVLTLTLVRSASDGLLAVATASSGTLWAGLLVAPAIHRKWRALALPVNRSIWRQYFQAVRPTIVSGFFSSASASTPPVLLGWISGITQVGFFTAADRLTRAAAHLIGVMEQSLMGPLARAVRENPAAGRAMRRKLLWLIALGAGLGCLSVGFAAPGIIRLVYGGKFEATADLFRWLSLWLWIFVVRRAGVLFTWSLHGNLPAVSRFQWLESITLTAFAALGALWANAAGLVHGMIACEMLLGLVLWHRLHREQARA